MITHRLQSMPDLSVDGHLSLWNSTGDINLHGEGERLILDCTTSESAVSLLACLPVGIRTSSTLASLLHATGLTAEIRIRGKLVARAGAGASSIIFKLIGLPHIQADSFRFAGRLAARLLRK